MKFNVFKIGKRICIGFIIAIVLIVVGVFIYGAAGGMNQDVVLLAQKAVAAMLYASLVIGLICAGVAVFGVMKGPKK